MLNCSTCVRRVKYKQKLKIIIMRERKGRRVRNNSEREKGQLLESKRK